jgi:hypothetical protein
MYGPTLSLTPELNGSGWLTPRPTAILPGGPDIQRIGAGWAENLAPPGFDPQTV